MTEGGLRLRTAGYSAYVLRRALFSQTLATLSIVLTVGATGAACDMDGTGIRSNEQGEGGGANGGSDSPSFTGEGGTIVNPGSEAGASDGSVTDAVSSSIEAASDDAALPRGPTPATAGVNFPFPQNRQSSNCIYPSRYLNSDVQAAYAKWTSDTVTSAGAGVGTRGQRLASDPTNEGTLPVGSTVSEGIGYGMLIAVYMGDQTLFDGLWKYEQQQLDVNGLMNWSVGPDGTMNTNGAGGATDADEDMAFALVMADKQWGGQGSLSQTYATYALKQIKAIWANEIWNYQVVIPGDQWNGDDGSTVNISYFAPAYYRVFATLDPVGSLTGDNWSMAIDSAYSIIGLALNATNGNRTNGLVPAWCSSAGGAPGPGQPTNYQYDSCRTPFRIGLDWCWNAEPRAQQYVALTSAFFNGIGAANITDGYQTNGSAATGYTAMAGELSAAFIGPAGVGAMGGAMSSSTYQPFVNGAYNEVATLQLLAAGTYYEDSWTVMSLLMMSANFLDYTRY